MTPKGKRREAQKIVRQVRELLSIVVNRLNPPNRRIYRDSDGVMRWHDGLRTPEPEEYAENNEAELMALRNLIGRSITFLQHVDTILVNRILVLQEESSPQVGPQRGR